MQQYIVTDPDKLPVELSLGIIGELPEKWQSQAKSLVARRQKIIKYKPLKRPICDQYHSLSRT